MKKNNIVIQEVISGSIAEEIGIEKGDILVSINDTIVSDILEYKFLVNDDFLTIVIEKPYNEEWELEIEKEYHEDLGLVFENPLIDQSRSCHNKCMFCFIDQMPKNMRETLYFKDDDYRLSFLDGNYVTLTNIKSDEIDKIIKYRISPINISVHTTNPELRIKMVNNKNAGNINEYLKKLSDAGISMNCQIVLCPEVNDGQNLDKTLNDLSLLHPAVKSIAVVPVGLTKYRDDLYHLKPFDKTLATNTIKQIESHQKNFLEKYDTRLVYAADEFYILSDLEFPKFEAYESFAQIENGVGLIAQFKNQFYEYLNSLNDEKIFVDNPRTISIVTGVSAYQFIRELCDQLENKYKNLKINVFKIINNFFGENITVTGLTTGCDIIKQLKGINLGDQLLIPQCMLRYNENVFLDDVTIPNLEQELGVNVKVSEVDGKDFIDCILGR